MWALNAAMKNLLDHFAYMFHRPSLFGKQGMAIATAAGVGEKDVAKYLKTVLGQWGVNGAVVVTQTIKEHSLQTYGTGLSLQETLRVDKAVERFYDNIKSGRQFSPSVKGVAVHNAFRAMSLSKYSESERDTQHWSKDGLRDKAYPVDAGIVKRALGTLVYTSALHMTDVAGRMYEKRRELSGTAHADTK
jgi:multimeric flavodoxin WrbA